MSLKHLPLPREHGAWAMFLIPLTLGAAVAGQWTSETTILTLAALGLFFARAPLALQLKAWSRGRGTDLRLVVWVAIFLAFGLGGGIWLVTVGERPGLFLLGLLGGASMLLYLAHVVRQMEKSVPGELTGIAGLALSAPAAYYVATDRLDTTAVLVWLLCLLYFGGSVFYIKLKVRQQPRQPAPKGVRDRLVAGRVCLTYQAVALNIAILVAALRWAPPLVPLAFIPVAAKTLTGVLIWQDRRRVNMLRLGLTEVAHSLLFGLLAWLAYRWPPGR